ncbi:hypothetical protein BD626DRAFT_568116 [Schizophyllum amplum]|uniref:Uncharacterized protein n=1 Tax=Schizophyllum amplum TaxID=97359 RepID=A0A550CHS0_9AGAR|nr:hypothetical protein BD626DRAFT_568116 [Auriculariopsis ampla]
MQTRRATGVTPLAIVLPHPQLPRRRSNLISGSASPRTPRGSPTCSNIFLTSANRKSCDSWNSSIHEDEKEWEWKPEQLLLLIRTLDALPSHLYTPFNGSVPPSNLLDKIARGVAQAKGAEEWPHSLRQTRQKLIELSRARGKDESIPEETSDGAEIVVDDSHNPGDNPSSQTKTPQPSVSPRKRPLYRQSSMEFLNATASDLKDNDTIDKLSNRLQRTDRYLPQQTYHPYSRPKARRLSSPPRPNNVPSLINATSSSSTLSSLASSGASPRPYNLRRSSSFLSSGSSECKPDARLSGFSSLSGMSVEEARLLPAMPDPRVTRVRRSESFYGSSESTGPSRQPLKRAPSYSASVIAQKTKQRESTLSNDSSASSAPGPGTLSSDEEEKARSRSAKKLRTKSGSASSPKADAPASPTKAKAKSPKTCKDKPKSQEATEVPKKRKPAAIQRHPSLLGPELPGVHQSAPLSPAVELLPAPASPRRTLRRVKRLPPGRRISFGVLSQSGNDADMEEDPSTGPPAFGAPLGSAFQLH